MHCGLRLGVRKTQHDATYKMASNTSRYRLQLPPNLTPIRACVISIYNLHQARDKGPAMLKVNRIHRLR